MQFDQIHKWVGNTFLHEKKVLVLGYDFVSPMVEETKNWTFMETIDKLSSLGTFDVIFWSDCTEELSLMEVNEILEKGNQLLNNVKEEMPHLRNIKYSDEDLEAFCDFIAKTQPLETVHFLKDLLCSGQVSQVQYDSIVQKYQLPTQETKPLISFSAKPINIYPLLRQCLEQHLHAGGRMLGFSMNVPSLYENVAFFENVITHPNFAFEETTERFQERQGIFFNILKRG